MLERPELFEPDRKELAEGPAYRFELDRREWLGVVGAGLLISASGKIAYSAETASLEEAELPQSTRLHLADDGSITVLTGKVEFGQGARTEIQQAAAEELKVAPDAVEVRMADTSVTPDDGPTFGSRTTPSNVPVVRRTCAAAREMLLEAAAEAWGVDASALRVRDGRVSRGERTMDYAELARSKRLTSATDDSVPRQAPLTPVEEWTVLGRPLGRSGAREIVSGRHAYPSDLVRPGMLYGAVLRAPAYEAELENIDLSPAEEHGATAVREGQFVGCTAKTSYAARQAVAAIARTAKWRTGPHPSSEGIGEYLKQRAKTTGQGWGGPRSNEEGDVEGALERAGKVHEGSYEIPFIQHAPLEPRAALAGWQGRRLTVWTGTQVPSRVLDQLKEAFGLTGDQARVIVPDTGGGFGGKHTGEVGVEAARLAKAAGKPGSLRWRGLRSSCGPTFGRRRRSKAERRSS